VTSRRKIEANRRNAQRSTGPRTPEGKAVARMNALKHGLTASTIALPGEDAEAYERLRNNLVAALHPKGALELELVDRIAECIWRLRRARNVERGVLFLQRLRSEINSARWTQER
jgi:hypothetical protein